MAFYPSAIVRLTGSSGPTGPAGVPDDPGPTGLAGDVQGLTGSTGAPEAIQAIRSHVNRRVRDAVLSEADRAMQIPALTSQAPTARHHVRVAMLSDEVLERLYEWPDGFQAVSWSAPTYQEFVLYYPGGTCESIILSLERLAAAGILIGSVLTPGMWLELRREVAITHVKSFSTCPVTSRHIQHAVQQGYGTDEAPPAVGNRVIVID